MILGVVRISAQNFSENAFLDEKEFLNLRAVVDMKFCYLEKSC
jgi:hypothetical protein